ncbi:MAG: polyprenyl synthetase family protein [Candidatus Micrarchaeia archaeon]|jgi:geranylgeranyl pyrophosphate synthase
MQALQAQRNVEIGLQQVVAKIQSLDKKEFASPKLYAASLHLLEKPGKLLRPALVFIGSMMLDLKEDFVDLAAAVELLHVSSLIHDDIIDNSCTRRGTEAVHVKYGTSQALLAGDALIANAIKLAAPYGNDVVSYLSSAAMAMCAGEALEIESRPRTLRQYLQIAHLKTASLIGASLSVTAIYAKSRLAEKLNEIGAMAGIAFQIRDDVLDYLEGEHDASHSNIIDVIYSKTRSVSQAVDEAVKINNANLRKAILLSRSIPDFPSKGLLNSYLESIKLPKELR